MKKVLIISMIIIIAISVLSTTLYKVDAWSASSEITEVGKQGDSSEASKSAINITGSLLNIFRIAAVGIALIMLVIVAIKYMSAAPEGKAEIKKHAVIYVVGAVVLFASAAILSIIQNFASTNISG